MWLVSFKSPIDRHPITTELKLTEQKSGGVLKEMRIILKFEIDPFTKNARHNSGLLWISLSKSHDSIYS